MGEDEKRKKVKKKKEGWGQWDEKGAAEEKEARGEDGKLPKVMLAWMKHQPEFPCPESVHMPVSPHLLVRMCNMCCLVIEKNIGRRAHQPTCSIRFVPLSSRITANSICVVCLVKY